MGGVCGCVFCLSLFFGFHTIWGVNTLGTRASSGSLPLDFTISLTLSLSGKLRTSQGERENGIMRRWEVEIDCYCPFGKLKKGEMQPYGERARVREAHLALT